MALARAFLTDPTILVLDDSTSAIDSATEDEIQKAIRRAQEGRTVLLITHRLSQIRWADRILVLDEGRLIDCAPHHVLIARPGIYQDAWRLQEGAVPDDPGVTEAESAEPFGTTTP